MVKRSLIYKSHLLATLVIIVILNHAFSPVTASAERVKPLRFPIGFWSTGMPLPTDTAMLDDWDEAGFSMIYGGHFTYNSTVRSVMQWLLEQAELRNMQVIIEDTRIDAPGVGESIPADYADRVQAVIDDYGSYPALFGFKIDDEPHAEVFENTYACVDIACQVDPNHQIIINMFPWYNWTGSYYEYSNFQDFMVDFVYLHANSCMEIFSTDCYFQMDTVEPPENGTWDTFFGSMHRYGGWARRNEKDFWHLVLATPHTCYKPDGVTPRFNYEIPNEAAIRWQFNCSIAYGAHGVFWYTFYTPNSPGFGDGPIDKNGNRTEIFYWLKNTHQHFRQTYGDKFLKLELTKVMQAGQQFGPVPTFVPDELVLSVEASGGPSSHPFIVSRFTDSNDEDFVMLVNNTHDVNDQVLSEVTLNDPNLTVYRYEPNGVVEVNDVQRFADNCKVQTSLEPGAEVLYRVEYNPSNCGDLGTVYLSGDFTKDCYIGLDDFSILSRGWLQCTDPQDSNCNEYWNSSQSIQLYDDFNDAGLSATLWTVKDTPSTPVTFDGSKAILNLQEPSEPGAYEAKIIANLHQPPILSQVGDSFRITWDMQRNPSVYDWNGWVNGVCIGNDESHIWCGGQYGLMNNSGDQRTGSLGMSNGWGDWDADYYWYHHDAYMEVVSITIGRAFVRAEYRAYNYNSAYDSNPDMYRDNETPVREVINTPTNFSFPINTPLSVRFYMNDHFSTDTPGHWRGENFIDNVFISPATFFPSFCGDIWTVCLDQDLNKDCSVNLSDLSIVAEEWLACTDPNEASCDIYWE